MKVDRFFPPEARERVSAAVREAEARTVGQIVPVVVERSARYPETRWMAGVLAAALATAVAELPWLEVGLAELPFLQVAAGLLGAWLGAWEPVERFLAGRGELDRAVLDRAEQAFLEQGLHRTAQGTGVLVFASLREHRAVVLGDRGIHAKMGDAEWRRAVDALTAGIRADDPARGFADAVALVGATLAEHFPRSAGGGPGNELPDELRSSDR
jgi:putative membrane protein